MNKTSLILKYFQKKDKLTVEEKGYQKTISSLFEWMINNDKVNNDKTSKYFPNKICTAKIISKDKGILAGVEEIEYLLKSYTNLAFKPKLSDGQKFKEQEIIAQISGKSHEILGYERTILNILQRMSGIATETNRLINLINPPHCTAPITKSMTNTRDRLHLSSVINTLPFIAATRKTPYMLLDKKAVAAGGGLTHRLNLSDGILIKDNHLKVISKAIKPPRGWQAELVEAMTLPMVKESKQLIEIEVETEKQAHTVIKTFQKLKAHNHLAILLDNFTPSQAKILLRNLNSSKGRSAFGRDLSQIIFEASGGINESNIVEWSQSGVDILSLGSLTHSSRAVNLSLEIIA